MKYFEFCFVFLLFFEFANAKVNYRDTYMKFHLEGCNSDQIMRNGVNLKQILFFKFRNKASFVSFSTESRVVFSDCFLNQIPSSWKEVRSNSSSTVYLKKKHPHSEFLHYRVRYRRLQNETDGKGNFVELNFREVEFPKNYTENFGRVEKDFELNLYCLDGATAKMEEGQGFVFCGEKKNLATSLTTWQGLVSKSKTSKSRKFVIVLVSAISGLMVSCLLCCLCCNCWRTRREAKKGVRGRRGSNLSSSAKTKEIEV